MSDVHRRLIEWFAAGLMIIGVLIAVIVPSAVISYIIMLLFGIFTGRIMVKIHHKEHMPYILMLGGFVIGYLLGVYYGSRLIVLVSFIVGVYIGNYLYKKGILKDSSF